MENEKKKFQAWITESESIALDEAIKGKFESKVAWLKHVIELTTTGQLDKQIETPQNETEIVEEIEKTDFDTDKHYDNKIQEAREKAGLKKTDVAKLVGITRSYYHHIESGNRKGNTELAIKISALIGLSIEDFVKYQNEIRKRN